MWHACVRTFAGNMLFPLNFHVSRLQLCTHRTTTETRLVLILSFYQKEKVSNNISMRNVLHLVFFLLTIGGCC